MQFTTILVAAAAIFTTGAIAGPVADASPDASPNASYTAYSTLSKRGCSRSNSGTWCAKSRAKYAGDVEEALNHLKTFCQNGNLPGNAKRVASKPVNGKVAYACNGFCRTPFMPCQDMEWSIRRVINGCKGSPSGLGWDSQETRGTWFGIAMMDEKPCGYDYKEGATY